MDDLMIEERLNNLDHRLSKVEQILPTLATKEDLKVFATKEELRACEDRLRAEIRAGDEETRRHMTMLIEHQDSKIQLIAEHLLVVVSKLDQR